MLVTSLLTSTRNAFDVRRTYLPILTWRQIGERKLLKPDLGIPNIQPYSSGNYWQIPPSVATPCTQQLVKISRRPI